VHVGGGARREAEGGDGDGEGEDCPEERGEWEGEEACEEGEAALVFVGTDVEILGLLCYGIGIGRSYEGRGREDGGGKCTHGFVFGGVGASAVSPDVVHANDKGEHGEEHRAERGGLWEGSDVLWGWGGGVSMPFLFIFIFGGVNNPRTYRHGEERGISAVKGMTNDLGVSAHINQ